MNDLSDLRERILRVRRGGSKGNFILKHEKRNKTCLLKPKQIVLYRGDEAKILDNNTGRGHSHCIQILSSGSIVSIIDCSELKQL